MNTQIVSLPLLAALSEASPGNHWNVIAIFPF